MAMAQREFDLFNSKDHYCEINTVISFRRKIQTGIKIIRRGIHLYLHEFKSDVYREWLHSRHIINAGAGSRPV